MTLNSYELNKSHKESCVRLMVVHSPVLLTYISLSLHGLKNHNPSPFWNADKFAMVNIFEGHSVLSKKHMRKQK